MAIWDGIKRNVYVLGAVSFLTDVSSEMVFPILPVFLTTFLGAGKEIIGLIEGVADSLSSLMDIIFGYWSDISDSRKKFVFFGYGLSSLSKAGIALAMSWPVVLVFRGLDRMGKSMRTSPRDAIIAASSEKGARGKAFGLHRAMDTLGAILGPAIVYVMFAVLGSGEQAYRAVFFAALIPAFLAVAAIILFVREPQKKTGQTERKPHFWKSLSVLGSDYKRFLLISCLFSLSYFSFALFIVRANDLGIGAANILLAYILYNIAYAVSSVPIGEISDKIGRKPVIAGAFVLYALVTLGFAFAGAFWHVALLFVVYGIFVAADESVNKAYISDLAGEKTRGIALGAYNTAIGAVYLPASAVFGFLWATFGVIPAFGAAAAIAAISGLAMFAWAK